MPCANVRSHPSAEASGPAATAQSRFAATAANALEQVMTHGYDNQGSAIRLMEIACYLQPHRVAIGGALGNPPRWRKHLLAGGTTAGARSLRRRTGRRARGGSDRHHAGPLQRAHTCA